MADPAVTTSAVATTTTSSTAAGSSGGSGFALEPAIVEALRAAVQTEVRAALPLGSPGPVAGSSVPPPVTPSGTPLLPAASASTAPGEFNTLDRQHANSGALDRA